MIATISHDIRTPLNQMTGMIMLLKKKVKGKLLDYVSVAEEAAAVMLNLANDMIDLYKIRKGIFDIKKLEFKVSEIEARIHKLFKFSFKQKKIHWGKDIDPALENLTLIGDSQRIK